MMTTKTITIRKQRHYDHPPEDVWVALTDARALAEWFEPNDHQPVVGHKFKFVTDQNICGRETDAEVVEVEVARRLVWRWITPHKNPERDPPGPLTITWTLAPEGSGTTLTLEQSGCENISWMQRTMMRFGWTFMMKKLIPRVLGNVRDTEFTPGAIPLNKRYYKCKTVPAKYVR